MEKRKSIPDISVYISENTFHHITVVVIYFILGSEINVYLKQLKMVFSQSETI